MKKLNTISVLFVLTLFTQGAFSAVETKTFQFNFKFKGESYKITNTAPTWEKAYEIAAIDCFKHFQGNNRLSEDQGLDVIDVCANPR